VLKAKLASVSEGLSSNITLFLACNLWLVKAAEGFTQCPRRLCYMTAYIVYYFIILCIAILIFERYERPYDFGHRLAVKLADAFQ
jgi:hypothetical protein